ncbi:MAG: hypothetical protein Q4F95_15020 [Oscillospiraceae bacterium]|nr:hypothetical protein [Oscillospiraceae bacterium]
MDDNKSLMDNINKWMRIAEIAEIIFIAASALFSSPLIPVISIFFLLQQSAKNKTISLFNLLWHILACGFFAFTHPYLLLSGIPMAALGFKMYQCSRVDEKLRMLEEYPYFSPQAGITDNNSGQKNCCANTPIIINDEKYSVNGKPKGNLRLPKNVYEYSVLLSLIILILGGLDLHPLNWICCAVETFFLACALLPKNTEMIRKGIIVHIMESLTLLALGPVDSEFILYLFLIFTYGLQTFLYNRSYHYIIHVREQETDIEIYRRQRQLNSSNSGSALTSKTDNTYDNLSVKNKRRPISLVKCKPEEINYINKSGKRPDNKYSGGQFMDSISPNPMTHKDQQ